MIRNLNLWLSKKKISVDTAYRSQCTIFYLLLKGRGDGTDALSIPERQSFHRSIGAMIASRNEKSAKQIVPTRVSF
jgi:hypothetical protein